MLTTQPKDLAKAGEIVSKGGVIIYPTDTVYGLGCNPYSKEAVKRILSIKGRSSNPLPVLFHSKKDVEQMVILGRSGSIIAKRFWPGPLTIVCNLKDLTRPPSASLETNTLGVRIPNHAACIELIRASGGILVGTSANLSGQRVARSSSELDSSLTNKVDALIDGGQTPLRVESTVIKMVSNKIVLIREGHVKMSELKMVASERINK